MILWTLFGLVIAYFLLDQDLCIEHPLLIVPEFETMKMS